MITIVSGLPRSGTSLMMRMLEVGGMPVLTDNARRPDDDNPYGYYEYEPVKRLKENHSWLDQAEGKAVKVVSMLLYDLPLDRSYKIVFMRRDLDEVLASQAEMLEKSRKGIAGDDDLSIRPAVECHLVKLFEWLERQTSMPALYCDYDRLIESPVESVERIIRFLDVRLSSPDMIQAIDAKLYRHRVRRPIGGM